MRTSSSVSVQRTTPGVCDGFGGSRQNSRTAPEGIDKKCDEMPERTHCLCVPGSSAATLPEVKA
jgi:hypothetical protein